MADTTVRREVVPGRRNGFITWLALILAIAALTLAWLAYNRSGEDLEAKIQRQVDQSLEETQNTAPSPPQNPAPAPSPQPSTQTEDNPNRTDSPVEDNPN